MDDQNGAQRNKLVSGRQRRGRQADGLHLRVLTDVRTLLLAEKQFESETVDVGRVSRYQHPRLNAVAAIIKSNALPRGLRPCCLAVRTAGHSGGRSHR